MPRLPAAKCSFVELSLCQLAAEFPGVLRVLPRTARRASPFPILLLATIIRGSLFIELSQADEKTNDMPKPKSQLHAA
jgi:hypothetical protein